jgi:hypothetical protein
VPEGSVGIGFLSFPNCNHAIFGWSDSCVATQESDLAVALAALDATVHVRSPAGDRAIPCAEFHRLPGNTPERDSVLERGDLIVTIEISARAEGRASCYLKVRDRQSRERIWICFPCLIRSARLTIELEFIQPFTAFGSFASVWAAIGVTNEGKQPWAKRRYLVGCVTTETFTRAPRNRGATFRRHVR